MRFHPVFHVSNLKRWTRSEEFERVERPPSPMMVEGHEEYEVETILRHKVKGASACIRCCAKVFPSPRLAGNLNRTSPMLLKSWRSTCAMSPPRTSRGGAGSEEAAQPIDGVPEDSWGHT